MSTFNIKFDGVKAFEKNIKKLEGKVAKKVLRTALKKGGAVIIREAKNNLPAEYDTLRRSIKSAFRKPRTQFYQTLKIGFTTGNKAKYDGWYAHIVEGGSDAHTIRAKGGKVLNAGDDNFAKQVNHPGTPARPFLRPAFDTKSALALIKFKNVLWEGIKKNLKR